MSIELVIAGVFAAMVIAGALMAAFLRHVLHAIIGLGITMFGLAGIYLYLGSPFVASMQILIYIGGISVAMVFAMMLSVSMSVAALRDRTKTLFSCAAGALFFLAVFPMIRAGQYEAASPGEQQALPLTLVGQGFMDSYNVVFEALSLVLLAAILGAILIARKEKQPQ
ncbi:NADH-quinone oxidoreductase subunit J [Candidatus Poribacteria bacterium]|nr:NADH-quinone oxidoreductase subunit J [Candidatus Poribacteria bacterium]